MESVSSNASPLVTVSTEDAIMKQLAFEKAPRRPLKVVRRVFQFQTRD
jgi:hypothetical protein